MQAHRLYDEAYAATSVRGALGMRRAEPRPANGVRKVFCESGRWSGVTVHHVVEHLAPGPVWVDLSAPQSIATIVLEQVGGYCEPRINLERPTLKAPSSNGHAVFVPAGITVWRYSERVRLIRDVRLALDDDYLEPLIGDELRRRSAFEPALLLYDDRVVQCARLLAKECGAEATKSDLYREGLTAALVALLFEVNSPHRRRPSGGLSPGNLKRVLEYLRAELASNVSLAVVARLAGLSLSQFTRAFRASTGVSPYRWLLDERVRRAQVSLAKSALSIAQIAVDVGFADQSHFTKAFRRATGTTPGEWRRQGAFAVHFAFHADTPGSRGIA